MEISRRHFFVVTRIVKPSQVYHVRAIFGQFGHTRVEFIIINYQN